MAKQSKWLKLFQDFSRDLRISSKEVSSDIGGSKVVFWESQRRFMAEVAEGLEDGCRIFNCLKSRQLGITTISLMIDVFWLAMHPHITMALVTDTEKNREANRKVLMGYVASFPDGYFGDHFQVVTNNRQTIAFSNGARLDLLVAGVRKKSSAWGEGVGYAAAHLTEVASYGDAEGLASFEESFAQQNPDRLFLYESTAKGFNHWHDKWKAGLHDGRSARSFFIGWWASDANIIARSDPRYLQHRYPLTEAEHIKVQYVLDHYNHRVTPEQLAWIRWKESQVAGGTDQMLQQNQPWSAQDAFVQSGYSFFQARIITNYLKELEANPHPFTGYYYDYGADFFEMQLILVQDENERDRIELKVYEEPVQGAKYVIGCDPAYGRNEHKDRSVISIWRCYADKLVQVAELATNEVEVRFIAWSLAHLAGAYEDCVVNVEVQGPGRMIFQEWASIRGRMVADHMSATVKDKEWENAMSLARWYLYARADSMTGAPSAKGFESTSRTKEEMLRQFSGRFTTNDFIIRSRKLLDEMALVTVSDDGVIGAPESRSEDAKDDRVFAAALANRAWIEWVMPDMVAQGLTYERTIGIENAMTSAVVMRTNDQVYRFLKSRADLAARPVDPRPPWMVERGLA